MPIIKTCCRCIGGSKTVAVILAHGSGNDMKTPLIVAAADGLCREGFLTLRFNFLYKEKGRKSPDSQKKLVNTWQCVFEYLNDHSFNLVKAANISREQIDNHITKEAVKWLRDNLAA